MRRFAMLQAVAPLAGKRALEFGCGLGTYAREMQKYSPHVFGFDIEIERVQQGAASGVTGLLGSVGERLPFADNTFDIVFSNDVLEHVQDDRECAREITRVLRPSGRAVIFVPNRLYFSRRMACIGAANIISAISRLSIGCPIHCATSSRRMCGRIPPVD